MIRVYVICEGQTEETFIRDVLAPILAHRQIFLTARGINTSKGHKGGALTYERVKRFVINSLKEDQNTVITTFFDLYALDNHFPDFQKSYKFTDVYQKVVSLEQAFKADIAQNNPSFTGRFFPYIQPYEFEGLLFSAIEKLTELEADWKKTTADLQTIRNNAQTPEHINDGFDSKPSARLKQHLRNPKFDKVLHGVIAIENIGIDKLLNECQHFAQWYQQLNDLNIC
ncbi:MAG: DUF4276 family protein [Methylobacter sp.]